MTYTKDQARMLSDVTSDLFKAVAINTAYQLHFVGDESVFVTTINIIVSLISAYYLLYFALRFRKESSNE